jgi:pyruvate formate lyase activating enzyme
LEVVGERLRADTVLERVLRDEPFFRHSAGGLTLSGGEPTHQLAFSLALLRLAGAAGLHRAVETCAFGEPERILTLLPHTELFLIDWKETDAERHRAYTGVANAGIRANLRVMHDAGARIQLRCPIIPGWNDRPDHFVGIAALARELPRLESVAVMPYHALGTGKAGRFGLPPSPCAGVEAPSEDTVAGWRDALRQLGVPVVA